MRSFSAVMIAAWTNCVAGWLTWWMWHRCREACWMMNWAVCLNCAEWKIPGPWGQLAFSIFPIHHCVANLIDFVCLVRPWNCSAYLMRDLDRMSNDDCYKIEERRREIDRLEMVKLRKWRIDAKVPSIQMYWFECNQFSFQFIQLNYFRGLCNGTQQIEK